MSCKRDSASHSLLLFLLPLTFRPWSKFPLHYLSIIITTLFQPLGTSAACFFSHFCQLFSSYTSATPCDLVWWKNWLEVPWKLSRTRNFLSYVKQSESLERRKEGEREREREYCLEYNQSFFTLGHGPLSDQKFRWNIKGGEMKERKGLKKKVKSMKWCSRWVNEFN